ncbi:hypothetical protein BD626DRAFT_626200 [Schizophyllum amplum]|uniref:Bromo domain-containing protein n=1 Tax=Schizophyllum amplum TaxID=97359 RepID=A0A550CSN3_9AGAR|nr:hypothetical protein BD626DRAFT_626200 [Auriculariopsis ampla]
MQLACCASFELGSGAVALADGVHAEIGPKNNQWRVATRGRTDEAEAQAQANARESPLSHLENLLLAQAAWENGGGGSSWSQVSKTLNRHALTNRPASYFNAPMCRAHHTNLLNDYGLDPSDPDNAKPKSTPYKRLSEILYAVRIKELAQEIRAEEEAYRRIVCEIEDIKAGRCDAKIKAESHPPPDTAPVSPIEDSARDDAQAEEGRKDEEETANNHTRNTSEATSDDEGASSGEEPLHDVRSTSAHNTRKSSRISSVSASRREKGKRPALSEEPETPLRTPEAGSVPPEAMSIDADENDETDEAQRGRRSKRKASPADDTARDKKRAREDSEATADDDPRARRSSAKSEPARNFKPVIIMLHEQISQHRNGNIFHNPIKTSEAPDYYRVVKRPIDLKTIKARIRDGAIANTAEFHRDILLMFANSMMYNHPETDIHQMAAQMMIESEQMIETHRQTEAWSQT